MYNLSGGDIVLTVRLYDDGHISSFTAQVIDCREAENKASYNLVLDQTAFFPNGGGQLADEGMLNGLKVTDVNEIDGVIYHTVAQAIPIGSTVDGEIDWQLRFARMQSHTGEHLVCGVAHSLYSCENTGFHMGSDGVTCDLSKPLTQEDICRIEKIANEAIHKNVPVTCFYPDEGELSQLDYRSKLDLTENVRLVKIEGYDLCACCAPHVKNTGEIGIIKIVRFERYKGGTRLLIKCGAEALEDYNARSCSVSKISALLCAKDDEIVVAVEKLLEDNKKLSYEIKRLNREKTARYIARILPCEGNACIFADDLTIDGLREIVNAGKEKVSGLIAAFAGEEQNYKYIMGSNSVNLQPIVKQFNTQLNGRGGGKPEMVQGSVAANKADIIEFLSASEM